MEFPSRSGGAQGGLIKGNLFAQSGAPAFSSTRSGDSTIHLVNGRIQITRDKTEVLPPYLRHQYFLAGKPQQVRLGAEPEVPLSETPIADGIVGYVAGQGVFIGDGYMLDLLRIDSTSSAPVLVSLDAPDAPFVPSTSSGNVPGANVTFSVPALMDEMRADGRGWAFPSVMATGWIDATRRYGFAVFGVRADGPAGAYQSKYMCVVGDTGTRTAQVYYLPNLPDSATPIMRSYAPLVLEYTTAWWGAEFVYREAFKQDAPTMGGGPARCYCVGRGHLLALLVGMERLGAPLDTYGSDTVEPYLLPAGSVPYLLRSRDFGVTWTMERADFLVADDPPTPGGGVYYDIHGDPAAPAGWPATQQRVLDHSYFVAAPFGGGRVAIAVHGAPQSSWSYDTKGWQNFSSAARAWRFYVSDTSGAGFGNVSWPMDNMRGGPPLGFFSYDISDPPSERAYEHPTFADVFRSARAYSFGPGNFVFASVKYGVTLGASMSDARWGTYPDAYPVTVWMTNDYGATWRSYALPPGLNPHATDWATIKQLYPGYHTGDGTYVPDTAPVRALCLGVFEPSRPATIGTEPRLPLFNMLQFHIDGSMPVYVSTDLLNPVASFEEVAGIGPATGPQGVGDPGDFVREHNRVPWEAHYTGDPANPTYQDLVYPGYPEFEALP